MSYLPVGPQHRSATLSRRLSRERDGQERATRVARLRRMVIIGLLVMTADWGSKALLLQVSPSSTTPHYTHPNPLAFIFVLAVAPLILRLVESRLMMLALGVLIGGCAGNLFERLIGQPVTDFIPLPHLLANPTCAAGHSCVLMCNVADLALWGSVPLLALAFAWRVSDTLGARRRQTAVA
ncbi:MAG TPA: signal peptidase II [Solirubrobacteraceae bacterium]|nr:signal peptidase II [Solirubrobacteraceae bacterium]